jgi:UDP-glucose 4-epimerase
MKILITGGAGFVGTNLIPRLLDDGHEVFVIDNLKQGSLIPEVHNRVDFCLGDITVREDILSYVEKVKPDVTFHFAGLVSIYDCHKESAAACLNNINGSLNVFDALLTHGCPRIIFSETSAVYENCELPKEGYNESQSDPTTFYSTSKACVALIAESYARTKGLQYTALRYFNVAGPIQDYRRTVPPLFAGFAIRMIAGNKPIIFGNGERRRDFIHVDDINDFHVLAMNAPETIGQTYNLGRGESYSLYEIGTIVSDVLRKRGYTVPDQVEYTMMPEINGEAFDIYADVRKANCLGWAARKSIAQALEDTIVYLEAEITNGAINPDTYMSNINTDSVKIG